MTSKLFIWKSDKQLGRAIRAERETQRLTQQGLARRAGVGRGVISQLELGKTATLSAVKAFDVIETLGYDGFEAWRSAKT